MSDGPFADIPIHTDDTLPPGTVKFLHGDDQATVFAIDGEAATPIATWPEKAAPRNQTSGDE